VPRAAGERHEHVNDRGRKRRHVTVTDISVTD
jgi:hypothetical protein